MLELISPNEMLHRLHLKDEDHCITPYDAEFNKQMRLAKEGMARYRNTLRALSRL